MRLFLVEALKVSDENNLDSFFAEKTRKTHVVFNPTCMSGHENKNSCDSMLQGRNSFYILLIPWNSVKNYVER